MNDSKKSKINPLILGLYALILPIFTVSCGDVTSGSNNPNPPIYRKGDTMLFSGDLSFSPFTAYQRSTIAGDTRVESWEYVPETKDCTVTRVVIGYDGEYWVRLECPGQKAGWTHE